MEPIRRRQLFASSPAWTRLRPSIRRPRGGWLPRLVVAGILLPGIIAAAEELRPWTEYQTMMWVGNSAYRQPDKLPLFFERLREMGIRAVTVHADRANQPLVPNGFGFYVENLVNRGLCLKFNSNVRDWDKFVTDWTKNGRPESALARDYSFDGDTGFATWDEVKPFTTDQIKARMSGREGEAPDWRGLQRLQFDLEGARAESRRWNFSPWADFRTYMDISLATTLDDLRRAARVLDPVTPVGIEGTQMPSAFGGYDLWRLAQVLDWVEPYDIGNAREILGSFMPGKTILTTVFEKETRPASRRLWHLLLEGDRGCIIWWSEDCIDWQSADYALTAQGRALAPLLCELQSPLAALLLRATREVDPIHLVYSQPSIQVDWLLESMRDGASWHRRFSSYEARHNRLAQKRAAWMKLLQDFGYTPQFVPAEKLTEPTARGSADAVLVMADALALSATEAAAARRFLAPGAGHMLIADGPAGVFDEHGRFRPAPGALETHSRPGTITVSRGETMARFDRDILQFGRARLTDAAAEWFAWAEKQIAVPRAITVPAATHTRIHQYRLGDARLVAFERNIAYHMSEDLKQAGGNEPLEVPVPLTASLAAAAHVYDLRAQKYLGHVDRISFTLDPWQPSLFALLPEELPADEDVIAALARRLP